MTREKLFHFFNQVLTFGRYGKKVCYADVIKYVLLRSTKIGILESMKSFERLSRKQVQDLRQLRRRRERYRKGLFFAEGQRAVQQILRNGVIRVDMLILEERLRQDVEDHLNGRKIISKGNEDVDQPSNNMVTGILADLMKTRSEECSDRPKLFFASSSVIRQISDTESSQGVIAVFSIPDPCSEAELLEKKGTMLVVDRVQDPGNLGTMIRTAAWFGLKGVVLSPGTVDLFHPKVVRGTAGATGVLDWLSTDLSTFLSMADDRGWMVNLLDAGDGAISWTDAPVGDKQLLVVGNEANGIASDLKKQGYRRVCIDPVMSFDEQKRFMGVESLNVSVAAGIMMARYGG